MSRKILSSALLVSLVSIPFVYLLSSQIAILVAQSASKGNRKPTRPAARVREKAERSSEAPAVSSGPREEGQVKWFNASKGFGFITRDTGEDIFVHFRSIRGDGHRVLKDGQRVEFSVSMGDKGLQADDVAGLAR